uniref:Dual specificity protein phosphatase 14 n=1 Tax=Syphacia muris TaxID=451379 RepID=A0A0N5AUB1_9BILA
MVVCVDTAPSTSKKMPSVSFKVNTEYGRLTELVPGLFICGISAINEDMLSKHNFSFIINATSEVPNFRMYGMIPRVKLWLDDVPEACIYPHLELQSDQIHQIISQGGRVLVHCLAGVSRSASICLAYLTKYVCRSLREAYNLMSIKRPRVRPNIGFWKQLIEFEEEIKGKPASVHLVKASAQDDDLLPDVYVKLAFARVEASEDDEPRKEFRARHHSGQKKFHPVLEPLLEVVEATA